jgi:hypothetical protein
VKNYLQPGTVVYHNISLFGRLRQENLEVKATLDYIVRPCLKKNPVSSAGKWMEL